MENKLWHCMLNNQQTGPLSENDMTEMINKNIINSDTLIWQEGYTNWFPLKETTLSMHLSKVVIPPPVSVNHLSTQNNNFNHQSIQIDNTLVWILAFAPIIGGIIDAVLGIWITTLIINIALSYADDKKLEKQGIDTSVFGSSWLIPIYLYKRAKYFGHNMAYFIIWLITFIISMAIPVT